MTRSENLPPVSRHWPGQKDGADKVSGTDFGYMDAGRSFFGSCHLFLAKTTTFGRVTPKASSGPAGQIRCQEPISGTWTQEGRFSVPATFFSPRPRPLAV